MSGRPGSDDEAVRDLCAHLFAQPQRLAQTLTHQVTQPFVIAPHEHPRTLQLDLILGCGGRASVDGRELQLHGTTAMVSYPGQRHGYELEPGALPSRVYHVKIESEADWPIERQRPLPPLMTGLGRLESLTGALAVVMRLNLVRYVRSPLLFARLSEALCLWPTGSSGDAMVSAGGSWMDSGEVDLAPALKLIEDRPAHPPSLDEMAEAVHLSTRHFARRFRAMFGCTPHAYITARRLDQARKLLLEHRLRIHEIAEALGFSSVATFSRWFSQHFGKSPTQYREDPTVL